MERECSHARRNAETAVRFPRKPVKFTRASVGTVDIQPICILMKMLKVQPEKRRRHLIRHWSIKKESIPNKLRRSPNLFS
jgi:hypothetical protein